MPNFFIENPQNRDGLRDSIQNILNNEFGRQPERIVFVCGDAHRELRVCNMIGDLILEEEITAYCSRNGCRNQLSLHLELGPNDVEALERDFNRVHNLQELELNIGRVLGWEPSGYALFPQLVAVVRSAGNLTEERIMEAQGLIARSINYFNDVHFDAQDIRNALVNLANCLTQTEYERLPILAQYIMALDVSRIIANPDLGQSINDSITNNVNNLFVHFVSVGNAHITGDNNTIINHIPLTNGANCVGISIERGVL